MNLPSAPTLALLAASVLLAVAAPARAQHMNADESPCRTSGTTVAIVACLAQAGKASDADLNATSSEEKETTVTFVTARDKHPIPFEDAADHIVVQVEVAGKRVWALVDNGAANTVIDLGLARQAGLPVRAMKGTSFSTGGHYIQKLAIDDVSLLVPNSFAGRMPMATVDLKPTSQNAGRAIGAVIGHDLLAMMTLAVNRSAGTLFLAPMTVKLSSATGPVEPIHLQKLEDHEQIVLSTGGKPLVLTLDLGASAGVSLTPKAWASVKPADAQEFSQRMTGASGIADTVIVSRLPMVEIGMHKIADVPVQVQEWPTAFGDGVMGMGILARYSFVLDIKAATLLLVPVISDASKLPPPRPRDDP